MTSDQMEVRSAPPIDVSSNESRHKFLSELASELQQHYDKVDRNRDQGLSQPELRQVDAVTCPMLSMPPVRQFLSDNYDELTRFNLTDQRVHTARYTRYVNRSGVSYSDLREMSLLADRKGGADKIQNRDSVAGAGWGAVLGAAALGLLVRSSHPELTLASMIFGAANGALIGFAIGASTSHRSTVQSRVDNFPSRFDYSAFTGDYDH